MKGRAVISLAGHDIGRIYLVVSDLGEYVLLSDGKKHRLNKPKRKNKKHIHPILNTFSALPEEMTDGVLRKTLRALEDEYERIIN